jgi:hypothetical protein
MLDCGVKAKCTLDIVAEELPPERKPSYTELERTRAFTTEAETVTVLNTLDLEKKFPPSEREEYSNSAEQAE